MTSLRTRQLLRWLACSVLLVPVAGCAQSAAPPAAPPRPVVDDAVVNQARFDCLTGKGFAVTRDESGAIAFIDPEDAQYAEFQAAERACTQELIDAGLVPANAARDLQAEYQTASALHTCLSGHGFPLTPWMSWEAFQDSEGQFNVLDSTEPIDIDQARKACGSEFAALERS